MSEWETVEGEHWAEYAEHYTRMLAPYGEAVLAAAAPQPGERVIDVGCGNGDLSLLAAVAVGPDGVVQGVDLSPAEVAVASRRSTEAGLSAARFAVADAARIEVDAPYDVLVSRFGVM
ncbi:MAG TPA: methyltransferase domain-containing protein, partial [Microthrixaceae bacterium]|nr:methyltransferase domain-containing protein [Microthrixaceae bacterium]